MSVKLRREVEGKIVGAFVDSAIAAGYRLSVSLEKGYDIDEMLIGSVDRDKIVEAAAEGDECHIFVSESTGEIVQDGRIDSIGWVYCVYGNDGWDIISDYTVNLDDLGLMTEAKKISDHYAG